MRVIITFWRYLEISNRYGISQVHTCAQTKGFKTAFICARKIEFIAQIESNIQINLVLIR